MNHFIFREAQYMRNTAWGIISLWFMLIVGIGVPAALYFYSPGSFSSKDMTALLPVILIILFAEIFLFFARLEVTVDYEGIRYRFIPFIFSRKLIEKSKIAKYEIRNYKPIREYGGWGIKVSRKSGIAYNMSGTIGMQLELADRRKILFGTKKPDEFKAALDSIMY